MPAAISKTEQNFPTAFYLTLSLTTMISITHNTHTHTHTHTCSCPIHVLFCFLGHKADSINQVLILILLPFNFDDFLLPLSSELIELLKLLWFCSIFSFCVPRSTWMPAKSLSHVWLFTNSLKLWQDGSLPDSSVCGIFQARLLKWFVISSSRSPVVLYERKWVLVVQLCWTLCGTRPWLVRKWAAQQEVISRQN